MTGTTWTRELFISYLNYYLRSVERLRLDGLTTLKGGWDRPVAENGDQSVLALPGKVLQRTAIGGVVEIENVYSPVIQ